MKSMNSLLLASTALLSMTALSPTAHADVRLPGVLAQAAPPAASDADKKAPANADKKAPAGEAEKKKGPEKKEQKPAAAQQQQQQAPKQAGPAAQQKPADAGAATAPAAQQPKSAQSAPDRAQRREERSEERQERRQERREERREDRRERKDADSASPSATPKAESKQTDKTDKPEKADKAAADKAAADKAAADKAAADKAAADKAAADKADKLEKQESPASRSPAAQSKSPDTPDAKQPAAPSAPKQAAPDERTKPSSPQQPAARSAPQQSAPDAAKSANPTSPQQAAPAAAPSATPGVEQQGAASSAAPAAKLAQPPAEPKDASAFIRRSDTRAAPGLDDLRRERREFRDGNRLVIQEGNRLIVREGDRTFIRHNALERFAVGARDVRVDRRRGDETATIFTRPNGVTIVTVTDTNGHMLRRVRRDRNGREIVIFDNSGARRGPVFVDLPPPRIRIPRERYILEAEHASPTEIYEVIMAPPVEEIERSYTVEQVRYSDPLRDRMPRVDLAINFETGSWQLTPDQVDRLSVVAKALNRALERNPREVFLIEGHTDAVGSDEDNLSLSDRRAETVAVALTEQFQVPPENLVTQGYGEQYLKVQTEGPSRENRRVSVRRITPLMAEQQAKSGR